MSQPDPSIADEPSSTKRGFSLKWLKPRFPKRFSGTPETPGEPASVERQEMRLRVDAFQKTRVVDVMIPRVDIEAVEIGTPLNELIQVFSEKAHSRLPVYRETLDDPLGFVHIKDILSEIASGADLEGRPLANLIRTALYAPPSMPAAALLVKMQASRVHLALVVDEYGGTDGLVSIEDLVEEIVGEIEDEHDEDLEMHFIRRSNFIWEADARVPVAQFQDETEFDLSLPDIEADLDTLGGIASALAGRVPVRGEILSHPSGTMIEIMDADARRIRRLRIRLPIGHTCPEPTVEETVTSDE